MSTGLAAQYNSNPRLFNQVSETTITSTSPTSLKNVRGQVIISIHQSDNPNDVYSSFGVFGGTGSYPEDHTLNWNYTPFSTYNCTINPTSYANNIEITTELPTVSRIYRFSFSTNIAIPPTVTVLGGAPITGITITIKQTKQNVW